MKIPHTIDPNYFKVYEPSKVALNLVQEAARNIKSEDPNWDRFHPHRLTELCLMVIVANFHNRVILHELPCWDKNYLLEILPLDLPLPLVVKHIKEEIYWKRRVKDRWKDNVNYSQDYDFDWKRMYLERHVQEAVEAMTPEGFDLEVIQELCDLAKDSVKVLNLTQLQIVKTQVSTEEEEGFHILPEPCDHIDLEPIITGLENLTELHVRFGLNNVGIDYKNTLFQFSVQDCRNLGKGVAKAENLRLLRIHSCSLNDEKFIALLSSMEANTSLKKLEFPYCLIGDEGATALARFLKARRTIKAINLSNNKITEDGIFPLAFVLTQSALSPLEYLNLKFNPIQDAGFKLLTSALVRFKTMIQVLDVSCCGLGEESGIFLGETLNRNSVLKDVNMSNNHLGEVSGRALKAAMLKNTTLQFLDMRMTEVPTEDILVINDALFLNQIRAIRGEAGIARELKMRKKQEEKRTKELEEKSRESETQPTTPRPTLETRTTLEQEEEGSLYISA